MRTSATRSVLQQDLCSASAYFIEDVRCVGAYFDEDLCFKSAHIIEDL